MNHLGCLIIAREVPFFFSFHCVLICQRTSLNTALLIRCWREIGRFYLSAFLSFSFIPYWQQKSNIRRKDIYTRLYILTIDSRSKHKCKSCLFFGTSLYGFHECVHVEGKGSCHKLIMKSRRMLCDSVPLAENFCPILSTPQAGSKSSFY